jgi:hypothetical protein
VLVLFGFGASVTTKEKRRRGEKRMHFFSLLFFQNPKLYTAFFWKIEENSSLSCVVVIVHYY